MSFLIVIVMLKGVVHHAIVYDQMPATACITYATSIENHQFWKGFAEQEVGPGGYVALKCSSTKLINKN